MYIESLVKVNLTICECQRMPKIVNHEEQRTRFAEAAIRLIASQGLEGMTMRAVAAEAGLSYGSLFHYFSSKDDLLQHSIRYSMSNQTRRANELHERYRGLEGLEKLLCDDAVINESSREAWVVWMTFLHKVALQESFARLHADLSEGWLDRIRNFLVEARQDGALKIDVDVEQEALALWAYSAGIGQLGLVNPGELSAKKQKRLIAAYLDKLRVNET